MKCQIHLYLLKNFKFQVPSRGEPNTAGDTILKLLGAAEYLGRPNGEELHIFFVQEGKLWDKIKQLQIA